MFCLGTELNVIDFNIFAQIHLSYLLNIELTVSFKLNLINYFRWKYFHQKLCSGCCIYMKVFTPPAEYGKFSETYTNIDQIPKIKIIKSANQNITKLHSMRLVTYLKKWSMHWHYFLQENICEGNSHSSKQNSRFIPLHEVTLLKRRVKCKKETHGRVTIMDNYSFSTSSFSRDTRDLCIILSVSTLTPKFCSQN